MILKNSQHPRGIDMGPSARPSSAYAGGGRTTVHRARREQLPLPPPGQFATPTALTMTLKGCPICGGNRTATKAGCIENVGPYLGPESMFPPTGWKDNKQGFQGSRELGWTPREDKDA